MDRNEFSQKVQQMREISMRNADMLEALKNSDSYAKMIADMKSRDPTLAELVEAADFAALGPLTKLIRYIGQRTEN